MAVLSVVIIILEIAHVNFWRQKLFEMVKFLEDVVDFLALIRIPLNSLVLFPTIIQNTAFLANLFSNFLLLYFALIQRINQLNPVGAVNDKVLFLSGLGIMGEV